MQAALAQASLADFGDELSKGNHEPAVVRNVESLTVTECDALVATQEDARTVEARSCR